MHDIVDHDLSQWAYKQLKGIEWANCVGVAYAILSLPEMESAHYVEGWVVFLKDCPVSELYSCGWRRFRKGETFEHAWLELDSKIIDSNWHRFDLEYFPIQRFDRASALQTLQSQGPDLPFYRIIPDWEQ